LVHRFPKKPLFKHFTDNPNHPKKTPNFIYNSNIIIIKITKWLSVSMAVQLDKKKYDPGSREMAGWILPMGSATDLNSSVPTHVDANRGVNTMWFLGDTQTTS
jgi:hypothetical protein